MEDQMTKIQRKKKLQKFMDRYFKKESHTVFLETKHPMLGRRPVDMLGTDKDFSELWDMLRGIVAGDFT